MARKDKYIPPLEDPVAPEDMWHVPIERLTAELSKIESLPRGYLDACLAVFNVRMTRRMNLAIVVPTWLLVVATLWVALVTA
jgi:hypothetical protein